MQNIKLIDFTSLSEKELKMVHIWRNHKDIRKWMFNDKEISFNEHIDFINTLSNKKEKYFLVLKDLNYYGVITFKKINFSLKKCHIGLYANPSKKGIGEILIKQCIKYAFKELNLNKIIVEVFSMNLKAISLYEKIGFKKKETTIYNNKELIIYYLQI